MIAQTSNHLTNINFCSNSKHSILSATCNFFKLFWPHRIVEEWSKQFLQKDSFIFHFILIQFVGKMCNAAKLRLKLIVFNQMENKSIWTFFTDRISNNKGKRTTKKTNISCSCQPNVICHIKEKLGCQSITKIRFNTERVVWERRKCPPQDF